MLYLLALSRISAAENLAANILNFGSQGSRHGSPGLENFIRGRSPDLKKIACLTRVWITEQLSGD